MRTVKAGTVGDDKDCAERIAERKRKEVESSLNTLCSTICDLVDGKVDDPRVMYDFSFEVDSSVEEETSWFGLFKRYDWRVDVETPVKIQARGDYTRKKLEVEIDGLQVESVLGREHQLSEIAESVMEGYGISRPESCVGRIIESQADAFLSMAKNVQSYEEEIKERRQEVREIKDGANINEVIAYEHNPDGSFAIEKDNTSSDTMSNDEFRFTRHTATIQWQDGSEEEIEFDKLKMKDDRVVLKDYTGLRKKSGAKSRKICTLFRDDLRKIHTTDRTKKKMVRKEETETKTVDVDDGGG